MSRVFLGLLTTILYTAKKTNILQKRQDFYLSNDSNKKVKNANLLSYLTAKMVENNVLCYEYKRTISASATKLETNVRLTLLNNS